jgi:Ni2+-binding GTPase involved in maturation of urease and hydrogenase
MEVPVSQSELNDDQKKVAHPLLLKTAMEVAGPPGTGKTKTIVELVRGLLKCTNFDILVLSERNGAINAIAEKFKKESLKSQGKETEITDLHVWMSVMAYGVAESMGESTKLFTVEEKLQ